MKSLLLALSLFTACCRSDAIPIEATFVGVNGAEGFGYYVGPFYGRLEQQSVVLYCVDFQNDVYFGQQWAANLSHVNMQSDLVNTRFGSAPDALQLYQQAAWLTRQYVSNSAATADIQATIWRLFDIYAPAPSSHYWLDLAQANYASTDYRDFFVVTNVGPVNPAGQVQEFLTVLDPSMPIWNQLSQDGAYQSATIGTPEPRLPGAVGGALIAMAVLLRYLRRGVYRPPR